MVLLAGVVLEDFRLHSILWECPPPITCSAGTSVCVSSSSPGHDLQGQGTQRKEVKFQPLPSVLLTGTDVRLALQWHV